MQIARKNYNLTLIVRGYRETEPQIKAPRLVPLEDAPHRKVRKERKAQPQFRTRMTRIARIFTDMCVSAFIRVHPRYFRNRQTLSAKLGLSNYIHYLCYQLWQKFTPYENLAKEYGRGFNERNRWHIRNFYLSFPKVNALRSELLFSVIYLGAVHRKKRKAQPQFGTRMTRIARIFTDLRASASSAQSVFHHVCPSLKTTASETKVSEFIWVHPRFFKNVIFQTGLTGLTGYVFNPVHPVILSNLMCQPHATWLSAMVREGTD